VSDVGRIDAESGERVDGSGKQALAACLVDNGLVGIDDLYGEAAEGGCNGNCEACGACSRDEEIGGEKHGIYKVDAGARRFLHLLMDARTRQKTSSARRCLANFVFLTIGGE
jgi:hypothetical protein